MPTAKGLGQALTTDEGHLLGEMKPLRIFDPFCLSQKSAAEEVYFQKLYCAWEEVIQKYIACKRQECFGLYEFQVVLMILTNQSR